jgi:hypothetical protein
VLVDQVKSYLFKHIPVLAGCNQADYSLGVDAGAYSVFTPFLLSFYSAFTPLLLRFSSAFNRFYSRLLLFYASFTQLLQRIEK